MTSLPQDNSASTEEKIHRKFLLFVAGQEPNSVQARQNLEAFCRTEFGNRYEIKVIDVFEDHYLALEHKILVTPCLIMSEPLPSVIIAGTLQDVNKVRIALRVLKD
jgi:circadian clock protein KaiB